MSAMLEKNTKPRTQFWQPEYRKPKKESDLSKALYGILLVALSAAVIALYVAIVSGVADQLFQ